jgi:hypothetical protein
MGIERRRRVAEVQGTGGFQQARSIKSTCEKCKQNGGPDVDDAEGDRTTASLHQALA